VVIDNEAGMEHLSRRTTNDVDWLLCVMNPTMPSLRAVERILELARSLPVQIRHYGVVVNRTGSGGSDEPWAGRLAQLQAQRLPDVPQDDLLERAGAAEQPIYSLPDDCPAVVAVENLAKQLLQSGDSHQQVRGS